jgi:hypothetical protein
MSGARSMASVVAIAMVLAACSLANRTGPDATCAQLQNGAINTCADGILATCSNGAVSYHVCDDKNACEASWQISGTYRCADTDAFAIPKNLVLEAQACGVCRGAQCDADESACYRDAGCTAAITCVSQCPLDPAHQAPCVAKCLSSPTGATYQWIGCVLAHCKSPCTSA